MTRKAFLLAAAVLMTVLLHTTDPSIARDYISVVGSSTVYPFAAAVAEQFGNHTNFKTPKIESTGSGGGFKLFCAGVGINTPDIANASRAIKQSEIKNCLKNGVRQIVEVRIGYDGIVLASAQALPPLKLTRRDIFLALAKDVPNPIGGKTLIPNPYRTWKEVNAALPDWEIEVLGPPPTSGTRDAFAELAMEGGAKTFDWIRNLKREDKNKYKQICHTLREDGAYIEAGENDNLIVQKLQATPKAVGIFGFSYLDQNTDKIQGAFVDGVQPDFDSIAEGKYPLSRPLFFYVKKSHVDTIPGMTKYIEMFTSDKAWGPEGFLADKGLIPMPDDERVRVRKQARQLIPIAVTQ